MQHLTVQHYGHEKLETRNFLLVQKGHLRFFKTLLGKFFIS